MTSLEEIKSLREAHFEAMLESSNEELGTDFEFHRVIDSSVPAGLTKVAAEVGAAAMVIGSSHRGPIGRVLMGDEGSRLAAGSPCPVFVTPRGWNRVDKPKISSIGIAFNGTNDSEAALAFGSGLARQFGASVLLAGVIPRISGPGRIAHTDRGYQEVLRGDMEKVISDAASRTEAVNVSEIVVAGNPADELATLTDDLDLLVMGSRCYGPIRRVLLGGTSVRVMRSSACPVVVVPRAGD